ncbi:MAG: hypothetical protein OXH54_05820 [Acidimicrobiaceae bacterium]|nr:hypothetical protein [Acidimicrobiaceae bacterium]MCY3644313.1 hypothetical protein [Acidimicrobiaceae bacterium]MDE0493433.1 hypothetical protein [Acidimicrobiaceae bacterium]
MPGTPRFPLGSRPRPGRSAERGLITLEWLLVVGAIAGLAASSVVIVQQVLDDHSEVPDDPLVRMLEADVAAAWVAAEAQEAFDTTPGGYDAAVNRSFVDRCDGVAADYGDVVAAGTAVWVSPAGPDGVPSSDDEPARCTVDPQPNLGA